MSWILNFTYFPNYKFQQGNAHARSLFKTQLKLCKFAVAAVVRSLSIFMPAALRRWASKMSRFKRHENKFWKPQFTNTRSVRHCCLDIHTPFGLHIVRCFKQRKQVRSDCLTAVLVWRLQGVQLVKSAVSAAVCCVRRANTAWRHS